MQREAKNPSQFYNSPPISIAVNTVRLAVLFLHSIPEGRHYHMHTAIYHVICLQMGY